MLKWWQSWWFWCDNCSQDRRPCRCYRCAWRWGDCWHFGCSCLHGGGPLNQSHCLHLILQSLLVSRVDLSRDTLTLQWKPSASTPSVPGSNLSDHTIIRPPIILKGHFCLQLFYWDRSLWNSSLSWEAEEGQGDNQ